MKYKKIIKYRQFCAQVHSIESTTKKLTKKLIN